MAVNKYSVVDHTGDAFTGVLDCGQRVSYNKNFYSRLTKNMNVYVDFADEKLGKIVRASKKILQDEEVLTEAQLLAVQNLDNRIEKIPVCGWCMLSLETPLQTALRVRKSDAADGARPLAELLTGHSEWVGQNMPQPVACRGAQSHGCNEQYCSDKCANIAWDVRHAVVCPLTREVKHSKRKSDAVYKYLHGYWHQGGVNYQDTFHIAYHIYAHMFCSIRLRGSSIGEAWAPFSMFISRPWHELDFSYIADPEDVNKGPTKDDELNTCLTFLREIYKPNENEEPLFQLPFLSRIIGMILLNGHERSMTSPFMLYKRYLRNTHGESGSTLEAKIFGSKKSTEHQKDLLGVIARGQGIYTVAACMNHSCNPNAIVSYVERLDETLRLKATRDIEEGEEITISYIDENADLKERQKNLVGHYGFACGCVKCKEESQK